MLFAHAYARNTQHIQQIHTDTHINTHTHTQNEGALVGALDGAFVTANRVPAMTFCSA